MPPALSPPRSGLVQPRAWGSSAGPHYRQYPQGDKQGLPGSPATLVSLCPVLRPRQDQTHQATKVRRHGPRYVHNEGSHEKRSFGAQWHGLGTSCLRFVVCVATPDAKLASGRWPSSPGRDWLPAGLRRKVSMHRADPPFRSFPGARTSFFSWRKSRNFPDRVPSQAHPSSPSASQ
jgi:hypothetical protein